MVENLIGQISNTGLGGITKPSGINLDDDTFAKLLEKASGVQPVEERQNDMFSNLGMPAGFDIQPYGEVESTQIAPINETQGVEIKDLSLGDNYLSSLLNDNSNIMNMAKKHATSAYNVFGKGFVDTINDFVEDTTSLIK
jgi:hypothetical protein